MFFNKIFLEDDKINFIGESKMTTNKSTESAITLIFGNGEICISSGLEKDELGGPIRPPIGGIFFTKLSHPYPIGKDVATEDMTHQPLVIMRFLNSQSLSVLEEAIQQVKKLMKKELSPFPAA